MKRVSLVNQHMTHHSQVSRFFLHLTTTVISINGESESGPQTVNANTLLGITAANLQQCVTTMFSSVIVFTAGLELVRL